jgi:hypothetical protein
MQSFPSASGLRRTRIVEAICQGQQPAELSTETVLNRINLPLQWWEQRHALGIK